MGYLGRSGGMRKSPGEDYGGVKSLQEGEEQQGAEQRRGGDQGTLPSDLTRPCHPSASSRGRADLIAPRSPPGRFRAT